jgi:hypothetical protein
MAITVLSARALKSRSRAVPRSRLPPPSNPLPNKPGLATAWQHDHRRFADRDACAEAVSADPNTLPGRPQPARSSYQRWQ